MPITREQLYDEVWELPMTKVAKRHGVSAVYLARICDSLRVPKPARGYWRRRATGQQPPGTPLPDARAGDETAWYRGDEPRNEVPPAPLSVKGPGRRRASRAVPPHPLVVEAREAYRSLRRPTDRGFLRPRKFSIIDIYVTSATLDRALRMADLLYKELERHGHRMVLGFGQKEPDAVLQPPRDHTSHWEATVAFIGETAVGLTIHEACELSHREYNSSKGHFVRTRWSQFGHPSLMPNGRLAVRAYLPYPGVSWSRAWTETRAGEFPSIVPEIIRELEAAEPVLVAMINEERRKQEEARRVYLIKVQAQEEQRLREEAERLRQLEETRREKRLHELLASWRLARDVRCLVEEARQRRTDATDDAFLTWASAYADRVDPFASDSAPDGNQQVGRARSTGDPGGQPHLHDA